jgi:hypothetical protein
VTLLQFEIPEPTTQQRRPGRGDGRRDTRGTTGARTPRGRPPAPAPTSTTSSTACTRTPVISAVPCAGRKSPATASTTPTCPTTPSPSISRGGGEWGHRARRGDARAPRVHPTSHAAPATVAPAKAQARLRRRCASSPGPPPRPADARPQVRRRQRGAAQYERRSTKGLFIEIQRGRVTLPREPDRLPRQGLFLDGRITCALIKDTVRGARAQPVRLHGRRGCRGGAWRCHHSPSTFRPTGRGALDLNKLRPGRNRLVQADALSG